MSSQMPSIAGGSGPRFHVPQPHAGRFPRDWGGTQMWAPMCAPVIVLADQDGLCVSQPTDPGSEGWGFESLRARRAEALARRGDLRPGLLLFLRDLPVVCAPCAQSVGGPVPAAAERALQPPRLLECWRPAAGAHRAGGRPGRGKTRRNPLLDPSPPTTGPATGQTRGALVAWPSRSLHGWPHARC